VVTEEEFNTRVTQSQRQAAQDAEEFVAERPAGQGADGTGPPAHWLERGRPSRRTSVIVDPPDGRIPFVNDEARKRSTVAVNARTTGNKPFDGPQAMDWYDRCITRGLPHVIFPTIYNNTSEIVQGPGYVAIRYEMIHDARVIPLDGRPALPGTMRQYFGDSRGRWDGDTLVVEVAGFKDNGWLDAFGHPHSDALRVTERFHRRDFGSMEVEITVEDPKIYNRPFTFKFKQLLLPDTDLIESFCENEKNRDRLDRLRDAAKAKN
jgi:hypothetical protein